MNPTLANVHLRNARSDDIDTLWRLLAMAAYVPDIDAARAVPLVAAHLHGWQRTGDFGVVAEQNGRACGAAWARQFTPQEEPAFFAGNRVPEVSIAVVPELRAVGIGAAMLEALERAARLRRLEGLCLSVRDVNPAVRLYHRAGYRRMPGWQVVNRVGGTSFGMVLPFGLSWPDDFNGQ